MLWVILSWIPGEDGELVLTEGSLLCWPIWARLSDALAGRHRPRLFKSEADARRAIEQFASLSTQREARILRASTSGFDVEGLRFSDPAFVHHRARDPHCTCSDCIAYHDWQQARAMEGGD